MIVIADEIQGKPRNELLGVVRPMVKTMPFVAFYESVFVEGERRIPLPHTILFGPDGSCEYRGGTAAGLDKKIEALLLKEMPEPFGGMEFDKCKSLIQGLRKKSETKGSLLKKAEAKLSSKNSEEAGEAKRIVETLKAWIEDEFEDSKEARDVNAKKAFEKLNRLCADFKGRDEIKEACDLLDEWKKDKALQKEITAWDDYQRLVDLEGNIIPAPKIDGTQEQIQAQFERSNRKTLEEMRSLLKKMGKWKEAQAYEPAQEFGGRYKISTE